MRTQSNMKQVLLICTTLTLVLGAPQDKTNVRIIGGEDADIANYPYMLQLEYYGELVCGAVLVSSNFALTSARCVWHRTIEAFLVRAGSATLYESGQELEVDEIHFHHSFIASNSTYDVALLFLSETVSVQFAKPIKLATDDSAIVAGANVIVAGWGWQEFTYYAEFSSTLQVIELPILSDEQCKTLGFPSVSDDMFCVASLESEGRGFCNGDNGGPAVINGILVGIMSFVQGCGDPTRTGVLIRASMVREWVENII